MIHPSVSDTLSMYLILLFAKERYYKNTIQKLRLMIILENYAFYLGDLFV